MSTRLLILAPTLGCLAGVFTGCHSAADDTARGADAGYSEVPLQASEGWLTRQAGYLTYCAENNGPDEGSVYGQLCRLALGQDVVTDPIGEACAKLSAREDCADFKAAALVRLLYLDNLQPSLPAATRSLVEQTLLEFKYWIDEPGQDEMCYWTENHQVLFHSSELLAGQLFVDDVFSNSGMTGAEHAAHGQRLVERWLDFRGRFGFSEWHSNVYFNEDIPALVNLADFALDPQVRAKAAGVLDLLAFDLLNNSFQGSFATVHGRTYESRFLDGLTDSTREAAWLMTGLGDYTSSDNFSAAFLATSPRYWPPALLEDVATASESRHVHHQHDSIDVAQGPALGFDYQEQDDIIFWAGLSALIAPEVIEGTFEMVEALDLWDAFLFGDIPDEVMALLQGAMEAGTLPELAETLEPLSRGICLEGMDTTVWRTPFYQLAGGQDYNPGLWSSQTQMWLATLSDQAYIFTSFPSDLGDSAGGSELAGEWIGSWLPRATLYQNVGVIQYQSQHVPLADAYLSSGQTHAFFPRERFDELRQQGGWTFGCAGQAYVALFSEHATSWSQDNDYELIAEGETNVWIVELGSSEEWASFDAFTTAITAAQVQIGDDVLYDSPSVGSVQVGWEGPMTVAGTAVDLGPYPRWDNTFAHVDSGATVTRIELDDTRLVLDFAQGTRRLMLRDGTADPSPR